MLLTSKQEAFAQAVSSGLTQADAYRAAYSAGNMKAETIQSKASILMADGKVRARADSLKQELANKSLWTREQSVSVLAGVVDAGDAKHSDRISAVTVLNRMQGFDAPTKHDVAVTFPRTINVIAGRA